MQLNLGTKIGRYEIRSLLGAGGMGEVYLAHDVQLGRDVALKLLKQSDDLEKLQRFRREAKIVSTLNHPNILTIHDFGEHEDFHYIISEQVKGINLRELVNEKQLSLNEVLDIIIQVGNALAVAHEANIIHRDIKPENIMVLPDGFVKVLDFGLAKLIDLNDKMAMNPDVSTVSLVETKRGVIVGTVNYMSPEQLRGKEIDEKSDIWSLGVVFFELITRQRPFTGESVSDVIAAILEHPLPDILQIDPHLPNEFTTILNTALQKKKNDRYQNVKDLVTDLKSLKNFLESSHSTFSLEKADSINLIAGKTNNLTNSNQLNRITTDTKPPSTWKNSFGLIAFVLIALLGIGGIVLFYQSFSFSSLPKEMKIKRVQTSGNITNATISPDGRFVVYVQSENGQESLWLRQVDEAGGKELLTATIGRYAGLTFSPDGNHIYFTKFEQATSGNLFRIPILGGSRQEIAKDVDSSITFSPNGSEFAFIRNKPQSASDEIIISNVDGSNERVLIEKKKPEFFSITSRESLGWSPDGKTIACPFGTNDANGEFMTILGIDVQTREEKPLTSHKWFRVGRIVWTNKSDELLITGVDFGSDFSQIFKVFRGVVKPESITKDLSDYYNLSIAKDSNRLLGVTYDKISSLFIASSEDLSKTRQISSGGFEGAEGLTLADNNQIIFTSTESGNRDIWKMDLEGKNKQQLTFDKATDDYPTVSKDGKIGFVSLRTNSQHLWQMNIQGGDLKQLTNKGGEYFPSLTPDGKWAIFSIRSEGSFTIWKVNTENGELIQLTKTLANWARVSPDGKLIACLSKEAGLDKPIQLSVISIEDGRFLYSFSIPAGVATPSIVPTIRWLPDGKSISYIATVNGISNLWKQPLTEKKAEQITNFPADRIFSFDWTNDGKQIVYARGVARNNLVLIEDY